MTRLQHVFTLMISALTACVTLCPDGATASSFDKSVPPPSFEFTFPCDRLDGCRDPGSSQQPDRQVRPFEGTLGRPCAYRWRPTPSGSRKVRVCH